MTPDMELVLLFAGLHLIGLGVLTAMLVMFFRSDARDPYPPRDEGAGGGGGGGSDRPRPGPTRDPRDGGLPLPDALPARFRLRDHARLADLFPPTLRRSAREPGRRPERV